MLQKSAKYIAPAIVKLINDSLSKCVFPDSLKFAEVSSLFKKKDALIKTNYRPVSILVTLSKIYESRSRPVNGLFQRFFSTLLSGSERVIVVSQPYWIWLKSSKALLIRVNMLPALTFDCLPHCLTICKLFAYGWSREACTLIASYLFQRKQRVKIGNSKSEWGEINKDVPQGFMLGPLIFNIFSNDLFYFVKEGNMYNYADDNSISVKSAAHWRGRGACGPALRNPHAGNRSHWCGSWRWIPRTFLLLVHTFSDFDEDKMSKGLVTFSR